LLIEARAKEPIIPLHLFANRTFGIGNIFGFLAGFAMFGAIIFLPVYLQTAKGMTPTESGLAMLPAVLGIFSASIVAGLLMTRTGRYKVFPVVGAIAIVVALLLMSTITTTMPYWQLGLMMYLFGTGLGMTMQTIVTAIQNDVSMRDMGTATSATTFFRQLGGAIGTAVFGAVLTSRLTVYLVDSFAGAPAVAGSGDIANDVQKIHALPEPIRAKVLDAFSAAIGDVFLVAAPFLVIALVAALFLKEIPLKTAAHGRPAEPEPESAAASSPTS
jgi:MFS family permease